MPNRNPPRSFGTLVADGGPLERVVRRSEALRALDGRLQALLPPELRGRCRVANVRDDVIIVHAESAAWATRLRYLAQGLAQQLLGENGRMRIRVQPFHASRFQPPTPTRTPRLSGRAARALREAAERVSDEALGRALRRLATRAAEES